MKHPVLLYDGVCNLCESSVQFIIRRDPKAVFRFAALQSEVGQSYLKQFALSKTDLDTMVLVVGDHCYQRSSAALQIAKRLSGAWPLLFAWIIVPKFIRDRVYRFIAKNRYRWFGKKEECLIPTPEMKSRFIE